MTTETTRRADRRRKLTVHPAVRDALEHLCANAAHPQAVWANYHRGRKARALAEALGHEVRTRDGSSLDVRAVAGFGSSPERAVMLLEAAGLPVGHTYRTKQDRLSPECLAVVVALVGPKPDDPHYPDCTCEVCGGES